MKKTTSKKTSHAKAAVTAALMAVPVFGMPSKGLTQVKGNSETTELTRKDAQKMPKDYWKYSSSFEKFKGGTWIAGVGDGHTIYENSRGEFFYIDAETGDMKTLTNDFVIKGHMNSAKAFVLPHVLEKSGRMASQTEGESPAFKMQNKVTLLGVDTAGNVIQENSKGERFYLNTSTGDMVFVK